MDYDVFQAGAEGAWINPDASSADTLAQLIESCPSGALRYERKNSDRESSPEVNKVTVEIDGPLTVHANYTLNGLQPDSPRTTLCRCGSSRIKPYCDGSHTDADFTDNGEVPPFNPDEKQEAGNLEIKTLKDGPLYLLGPHTICGSDGNPASARHHRAPCPPAPSTPPPPPPTPSPPRHPYPPAKISRLMI